MQLELEDEIPYNNNIVSSQLVLGLIITKILLFSVRWNKLPSKDAMGNFEVLWVNLQVTLIYILFASVKYLNKGQRTLMIQVEISQSTAMSIGKSSFLPFCCLFRYDEELASLDAIERETKSRTGQASSSRPGKDNKLKQATWK